MLEGTGEKQLVEYAFHFIDRLGYVLYEQDKILSAACGGRQWVERRAYQSAEHCEVSPEHRCMCFARMVGILL